MDGFGASHHGPADMAGQGGDSETVQSLHRHCSREHDVFDIAFCIGFDSGVAGVMFWNGQPGHGRYQHAFGCRRRPCSGAKITQGAMVQAFMNWAAKHPENWDLPAPIGVIAAMRHTWPCP
jgi:hypothetical protein